MPALKDDSYFRQITPESKTYSSFTLPRHCHLRTDAAVVLGALRSRDILAVSGSAGHVLIHPALDCDANQIVSAGVKHPTDWNGTTGIGGLYHPYDVDELASTAVVASRHTQSGADLLVDPHHSRTVSRNRPDAESCPSACERAGCAWFCYESIAFNTTCAPQLILMIDTLFEFSGIKLVRRPNIRKDNSCCKGICVQTCPFKEVCLMPADATSAGGPSSYFGPTEIS